VCNSSLCKFDNVVFHAYVSILRYSLLQVHLPKLHYEISGRFQIKLLIELQKKTFNLSLCSTLYVLVQQTNDYIIQQLHEVHEQVHTTSVHD
jgi:hypothetical protein